MAPGTTPDTVNAPEGVVVTANGNVFIGDTANNRVQRKSISGSSPGVVVGAPGTGANQFNQPTGLR
jgi:streptogramin lyase